jgi:hypothetical protein
MKCRYKKNNSETCKNNSLKNDKYCYWHSSKITEAEKNLNRSNGGKQKQIKCNTEFVEFEIESIKGVCKLNATLINAVLKNKIDLKIATGICYMLNLQMKAIELETIESKIFKMEDVIIKLPESFENE